MSVEWLLGTVEWDLGLLLGGRFRSARESCWYMPGLGGMRIGQVSRQSSSFGLRANEGIYQRKTLHKLDRLWHFK